MGAGDSISGQILATGKRVVILGGGDTGSDCLGTSNRHGATSVHQFELLPQPPVDRQQLTWPNWPMILRTSSSHEEGVTRDWSINTTHFSGDVHPTRYGLGSLTYGTAFMASLSAVPIVLSRSRRTSSGRVDSGIR